MKKRKQKQVKPQAAVTPSFNPAPALAACGILAGLFILYSHLLTGVYQRYYNTNIPLDYIDIPGLFEFLNRYCGVGLIVVSVLYLLYAYRFKSVVDPLVSDRYVSILTGILGVICFMVLLSGFCKYFTIDEVEHLHSTWYVKQGDVPYRDFFQHHNPLLWYLLLPLFYAFGDSTNTMLAVRIFVGMMALGIAFFTYRITFFISKSKEMGLISLALLFSSALFMEMAIEIRPDVPEVLFGMASIYLLLLFTRNKDDKFLFLSGLAASLSFLFLQKTIFLLICYGIVFAYAFVRKEIRLRSAFFFMGGFFPPLLVFLAYLLFSGSYHDYLLTNWLMNMRLLGTKGEPMHSFKPLSYTLKQNYLIWLIAAVAVIFSFTHRKAQWEIKLVTFLGLFQLLSLMSYSTTFKHYYLFAIPLLCVTGAYCIANLFEAYGTGKTNRLVLLALLIFTVTPFLAMNVLRSNRPQLARFNYFLGLTGEKDLVYDGLNSFNIFRRDLHYFWYQLNTMPKYNKLTNNRFGNYDIHAIIWKKRPKITTDFGVDLNGSGLRALYVPTRYPHFYVRKDEAEGVRRK